MSSPSEDEQKENRRREFGAWFQDKRMRAGHSSQKEFAALLGISDVQLSRIETGSSGIGQETLDKAIKLLKLDPREAYTKSGLLTEHDAVTEQADDEMDSMYYKYKSLPPEERQIAREKNRIAIRILDAEIDELTRRGIRPPE
jgi:transcriptional regulator with XRE-family HTH domain